MVTPPPPSTLRRRLRHARRWTGYGGLVLLILLAVLVGVANQLLPMVERHPDRIAAWLSERVGEPVAFSRAHAEWTRRGPRFTLDDLHVGSGASQLAIGRAQLQVAMYSGLLPGQPLTELKVRDLLLTLVQDAEGRWSVVGLPGQGVQGDPLDRLEGFGELQIERTRLTIRAPRLKLDNHLARVDARIRVNGPRLRVGVSARAEAGGAPLHAVLDLQRRNGDGLLWIGGQKLQLAQWHEAFAALGAVPEQGRADADLWVRVHDRRVHEVTARTTLDEVRLHSSAPLRLADGSSTPARVDFDRMEVLGRWRATRNGWQLSAPRLEVAKAGKVAHLGGLLVDGGQRFLLTGEKLDLSPLAAMLSLGDRVPMGARVFLQQANPQALLRDVRIEGVRGGPMHGVATVQQLQLHPFATRPGLSGLSGQLRFDERGGVFEIGASPVRVDWPAGLRQPQAVRLQGRLAGWKQDAGWSFGSDRLRILGEGYGAVARGELAWQGDGSAPFMALSADLDPASVQVAKQFWILHKMPPSTVKWLDEALVSGDVVGGRIAIGGDLDDWPFRNKGGFFDARAHLRDATVKFNPQWPVAEHMELDLAFDGPGFQLDGKGLLRGNPVAHVTGGIADFHTPRLVLDIGADTRGEALRELMIASPLNATYGQHLRSARIVGPARVALLLDMPLHAGAVDKHIEGTLDLANASLSDPRWDLQFTQVSGRTLFTHEGFATQDLQVRFARQPGVFNLRVGAQAGDPALAALASLEGRFAAPTLVDRYPDLAWLRPWMTGSSAWRIGVRVPVARGKRQPPSQLRVSSDLVGTALTLPEPLRKPASEALALDLSSALPIEQGEFALQLGTLMRMRGLVRKNQPMAAQIGFGDTAPLAPGAPGITVRGDLPVMDATGWVAFSGKGEGGAKVQAVDVRAARMIFLDRPFADASLQLSRGGAQTAVTLKGKGIEGSIDIPDENFRAVQGRFARLYLSSDATADAAAGGEAAASSLVVEDPSSLPPLRFNIADLRLGDAQLGKAELATSSMANGLRVDKFQTQVRNLTVNAAGEWVRAPGGGTRSNFRIDFSAASLGQMLDALGYKDMVEGGRTRATLTGSWPGSPGAFALASLDGMLRVDIGEGSLPDVEPGGSGRVLGLLSLAEIPRRLSLDFSDFFKKGFAFNTAKGDFVFADGKARTDNLRIDGPAAEVRVSGTTGMREQVYDQRVEVLPKAGGLLPAIGLLAGGPAGAAVGAMAQAVLQKPLKQSTRVVYQVTGPWQKPQVKVVEKGPARPAPPAQPPKPPVGVP